jgi:hypothetical protein
MAHRQRVSADDVLADGTVHAVVPQGPVAPDRTVKPGMTTPSSRGWLPLIPSLSSRTIPCFA